MHVLLLSHNYPYKYDPTFGFFCKQQAEALALSGHKVGVICPLAYSIPAVVFKRKVLPFGTSSYVENGISTRVFYFPSPPKIKRLKYFLFEKIGILLLENYIMENGV